MYKLNTTRDKLKSKIKKHFVKLIDDIKRLEQLDSLNLNKTQAILLVNINDTSLLNEAETELKSTLLDDISQKARIVNINQIFFNR